MKETAVQFLINNLLQNELTSNQKILIEQAKEMEKEQIKKAYYTDCVTRNVGFLTPLMPIFHPFENYFNKNYKQ